MKVGNLKRITKPVTYMEQLRAIAVGEQRYCSQLACPTRNIQSMISRLRIYEEIEMTVEIVAGGCVITRIK